MKIAVLLYDRFTMLDMVGPVEVLSLLPDVEVQLVATSARVVWPDNRAVPFIAPFALADISAADMLLIPGGTGTPDILGNTALLDWIRRIHATTRITASVCTGSLLLAAAGLLDGAEASTHWAMRDALAELGAQPVAQRWTQSGKIYTAAGVSAGIDLALHLAAQLTDDRTAQAIQLAIEYDPLPPFDCGSIEKSPHLAAALSDGTIAMGVRDTRKTPTLPAIPAS